MLIALATAALVSTSATDLHSVLRQYRPDSLVAPLLQFEKDHGHERAGGEAAVVLGQLHYARGEYHQAAECFARAVARLDPTRKNEARYFLGLSWLALRDPAQARAALEEVAQSESPRRADAELGVALAWELMDHPEQALDQLVSLLAHDPGEAGPAALERVIAISQRLHRVEDARVARERLLHDYPLSIEAARAATPEDEAAARAASGTAVQIGVFSAPGRARTLMSAARRSGFAEAQVVVRGEGRAKTYSVVLGVYASVAEAKQAGELANKRLGVVYRVVAAP